MNNQQIFTAKNIIEHNYSSLDYQYELSIIVPVYNVENYLRNCLNSLAKQTLGKGNYEVIVVNDGTKDSSQQIIDEFVENYPTIFKSLIKENGGLSDARNYGIPYAKGKYICFLDSDDFVELDLYENMVNMANDNNLDLVVSDLQYEWENEDKTNYKNGLEKYNEDINKTLFFSPLFSWNKLYRYDLFKELNLSYPKGLWYEDIPVTLEYFVNANRVGYYNKLGFHYLQRSSSILGSSYSDKMFDIFTIFEMVLNNFKEKNHYDKYYDELEYLFIEHFLLYGAFRFLRTDKYQDLMHKAFKFVKDNFPNYQNNKYLKNLSKKNQIFVKTNNKYTMKFWHYYLTK